MITGSRYQFLRRIDQGGMAEVWKAKVEGAAGFEKIIAIKRILPHLVDSQEFVSLFIEEAKLVASLMHPNIVQVFDFGELDGGAYFLAMEYVPGTNLDQVVRRLKTGKKLPLETVLYVGIEACQALGYAHSRSRPVIHRDVSPHNLLLSFEGEVKVADFGIAKVDGAAGSTDAGVVRGKVAFMSPEQANGDPLDHRSDLFSLGVVLYELLLGEPLYPGEVFAETFASASTFQGVDPAKLERLPMSVRKILYTALDPDPEKRYQTAAEMESDLTDALGSSTVTARQALASMLRNQFQTEMQAEEHLENPHSVHTRTVSFSVGPGMQPIPQIPGPPETLSRSRTGARPVLLATLMLLVLAVAGWATRSAWWPEAGSPTAKRLAGLTNAPTAVPTQSEPAVTSFASPRATPVAIARTPRSTPRWTPRSTPRPTPRSTPRPTPHVIATPPPASTGMLSVQARPWAEVWLDGKRISRETPLHQRVASGRHEVTVVHPSGFRATRQVEIPAGGRIRLVADIRSGTFVVKP